MDIIYNIDDKNNNRIKVIDDTYSHETYGMDTDLHIRSLMSSEEELQVKDIIKIKDELDIEYYAR